MPDVVIRVRGDERDGERALDRIRRSLRETGNAGTAAGRRLAGAFDVETGPAVRELRKLEQAGERVEGLGARLRRSLRGSLDLEGSDATREARGVSQALEDVRERAHGTERALDGALDLEAGGAAGQAARVEAALEAVADVARRTERNLDDALDLEGANAAGEAAQVERALEAVADKGEQVDRRLDRFPGIESGPARRETGQIERSLESAADKAESAGARIRRAMGRGVATSLGAARVAAAGLAVALAAVLGAAGFATKAAVDLGEQVTKNSVVFGQGAEDVLAFAKTTADAFGISERAALEAAGTFGNMLVPMGFAREEAAKMSIELVRLAADMASFNNASPEETLLAIRSGLAGETEPLRRYGVFLNEATIRQKALSLGLVEGKDALSAQAKAQATFAVIMEQTADSQGDFARTSESLANQQRILRARFEDLGAAAGKHLIPIGTRVAGALTAAMPALGRFATAVANAVGSAGTAVADFIARLRDAPNLEARIRVVWEGVRDLAGLVAGAAADAGRRAGRAIAASIERAGGWEQVGRRIAVALGNAFEFTSAQASRLIESIVAGVNANRERIAEAGASLALGVVAKLTDPSFWAAHWREALAVALTVFGPGLLARLGSALGRVAGRIGAAAARIGAGLAVQIVSQLARLPGAFGRVAAESAARLVRFFAGLPNALFSRLSGIRRVLAQVFSIAGVIALVRAGLSALRGLVDRGLDAIRVAWQKALRQIGDLAARIPSFLPGTGRIRAWGERTRAAANAELARIRAPYSQAARDGAYAGQRWGRAFTQAQREAMAGRTPAPGQDPQKTRDGVVRQPNEPGGRPQPRPAAAPARDRPRAGASTAAEQEERAAVAAIAAVRRRFANLLDLMARLPREAQLRIGPDLARIRKLLSGIVSDEDVTNAGETIDRLAERVHGGIARLAQAGNLERRIGELRKQVRRILDPVEARAVLRRLEVFNTAVRARLRGGVTERELAWIRTRGDQLKTALSRAFTLRGIERQASTAIAGIRAAVRQGVLSPAEGARQIASVRRFLASVRAAFRDGTITPRELARLRETWNALGGTIREGIEKGRTAAAELRTLRAEVTKDLGDLEAAVAAGRLDPDTAAGIREDLLAVRRIIAAAMRDGFVSEAEREAIDEAWSDVKGRVKAGIADAAAAVAEVGALAPRLDAAVERINRAVAEGLLDPATAATLLRKIARLRAALAAALADGLVTPAEAARIVKQFETLDSAIDSGVEEAIASAENLEEARDVFSGILADGLLDEDDLEAVSEQVGSIGGAIGKGISKALEAFRDARARFAEAWDRLKGVLLDLFDEQVTFRIRAAFEWAEAELDDAGVINAATRAQATIDRLTAAAGTGVAEAAAAVRALRQAYADYYDAVASGDRNRIAAAIAEVQAANNEIADLPLRFGESFSENAQAILAAGDDVVAGVRQFGVKAVQAADEAQQIASAGSRVAFARFLDGVRAELDANPQLGFEDVWPRIRTEAERLGIDLGPAADAAATAFSDPLAGAMADVVNAITGPGGLVETFRDLVLLLRGDSPAAAGAVGGIGDAATTAAEQTERAGTRIGRVLNRIFEDAHETSDALEGVAPPTETRSPLSTARQAESETPAYSGPYAGPTVRRGGLGLEHFQHGGVVPGSGPPDSKLVLASPGEMMVPRDHVARIRATLERVSRLLPPGLLAQVASRLSGRLAYLRDLFPRRYAAGGIVPGAGAGTADVRLPERALDRLGAAGPTVVQQTVHYTIPVHVAGSVTAERDLAFAIRDVLVQHGRNNPGGAFGGYADRSRRR